MNNQSSPLPEKPVQTSASKKFPYQSLFNYKSQKVLNTLSKFQPKHSKAYYQRLKPRKPTAYKFNSKNCKGSKLSHPISRNQARSESIRKENFPEFDQVQSRQQFKCNLLSPKLNNNNLKKTSKALTKNPQYSKLVNLELTKAKSGPSKPKHIISKGDKGLIKDFNSEFFSTISEVDLASSGFLNYSQFCKVLNLLKFIQNSFNKSEEETELVLRAWRILGGFDDSKIKVEDFNYFLLAILDVHFKLEQPSMNSPQLKQKRTFWNLSQKEQVRLSQDFKLLVLNRTSPKITRSARHSSPSTSSQEISDSDTPEIVIAEASVVIPDKEKIQIEDAQQALPDLSYLHSRLIRRISLRELSNTPNGLSSKHLGSQKSTISICETPKNLSFTASVSEDLSIKPFYSPKSQDSKTCISKIQIRRVSTKSELDLSKHELNSSLSYKAPSAKFKFPGLDENSDSSILNISEVHPNQNIVVRRPNRIPTIAERQNEELKHEISGNFLDSFDN